MTVSTETSSPVEIGVALETPLRLVLAFGHRDSSRRAVARIALASCAEVRGVVPADDARSFVELAQNLRDAEPNAVLVCAADSKDIGSLNVMLEALRLGCAAQRPPPRVLALGPEGIVGRLRPAAGPFALERFGDEAAAVAALRALRRGGDERLTLRDELIEDAARSLAASTAGDSVVVDVSERSTSCVLARAGGELHAAHVAPLGLGEAADRVVLHAGVDRVRRWLPWPIDAPALLDRVFNRARWPGALPATELALGIEMALAREAIAHVLRDAAYAGLDVAAMRAAPTALVTGRAASFPRRAQTLLVFVDGLEPTAVTALLREPDDARAERVALVASLGAGRPVTLRLGHATGRDDRRVEPGSFTLAPLSGEVEVSAGSGELRGRGHAGALGLLVDARGRPLPLPPRDAERIPAVAGWHAQIGAFASAAR